MPRSKNVIGDRVFDEVGLNQPDEERLHLGTTPNNYRKTLGRGGANHLLRSHGNS